MLKRDELIEKYADDIRTKCGLEPDMDLLRKVTISCGPSIYRADASTVSASDESELALVKKSFLKKKLRLCDSPLFDLAIEKVMEIYGRSNRKKYRAVVYYLLTKHFNRDSIFQ